MKIFTTINFIILVILTFSSNTSYNATSKYEFKWDNTFVNVPIYSSINDYKDIPVASLYIDDTKVETKVNIDSSGGWLYYLKNVNTSKLGTYKVWYKASENYKYYPGTCTGYKVLVTFNVIDLSAPKIIPNVSRINIQKNIYEIPNIDFTKYVKVIDDVDSEKEIDLKVDTSNIKFDTIGSYDIVYKATDKSGNQSSIVIIADVKNIENAIMKFKSNVSFASIIIEKISSNDSIVNYFKDFITITDVADNNIASKVKLYDEYSNIIDGKKTGIYRNAYFSVIGSNGEEIRLYAMVTIKDSVNPIINLTTTKIDVSYNTILSEEYFRRFLIDAIDSNDYITDRVTIDFSKVYNEVGKYYCYYEVYDDENNYTKVSLEVNIISTKAPIISTKYVNMYSNQSIDLYDYIFVVDESDSNINDKIIIDTSNFDPSQEGIYQVLVSVTNSSNLTSTAILYVEVTKPFFSNINIGEVLFFGIIFLIAIIAIIIFIFIKKRNNLKKISTD